MIGKSFDGVVFRSADFTGAASTVDLTDFAVYYNGDSPFGSTPAPSELKLSGFSYDPVIGDSEVAITGAANMWRRKEEASI